MVSQLACMTEWFDRLEGVEFLAILAVTLGCAVAVVSIVASMIGRIVTSKHREQSRRELAAYVAEGTLDVDKAVAMMNAGEKAPKDCLFR